MPITHRFLLGSHTRSEFLQVTAATVRSMGWQIIALDGQRLIADTGSHGGHFESWFEEVQMVISSESISPVENSEERNGQNLQVFAETFQRRLRQEDELYRQLNAAPPVAVQHPTASNAPWVKEEKLWFWKLFIPNRDFLITPLIVDVCVGVFIAMCIGKVSFIDPTSPDLVKWGANYSPLTLGGQWWRLLTAVFVHVGILHLVLNLFGLLYVAIYLEPLLGKVRFLIAFLVTGILASISSLWWHDIIISAGASGAIFGLYGVFIALLTTDIVDRSARATFLAYFAIIIGLNIAAGMKPGIDNAAHIGGLLSGLLLGYSFYPGMKWPQKPFFQYFSPAIMIGIASVVMVYSLGHITDYYGIYTSKMKEFSRNEDKALTLYKLPDDMPRNLVLQQIGDNGIRLWQKNIVLLDSLSAIPRMPALLKSDIRQLRTYCQLREQDYRLQYRRISEDTHLYDDSLQMLTWQIDSMLRLVNQEETVGSKK